MSDVDAALHPKGCANIDRRQITRNQADTFAVDRKFALLRFVNVG